MIAYLLRLGALIFSDSRGMILGYKGPPQSEEEYWYGKIAGADRKFVRVVMGAGLPVLDRASGAVVVLGEIYLRNSPPSFWALGAATGAWKNVESAAAQFRKDLKFTHIIVDREEAREALWRMRGLNYGLNEIPLVSYAAPSYAMTEIGRSYTDEIIAEERLRLEEVLPQLNREPAMGQMALRCAITWLRENAATYSSARPQDYGIGQIMGVDGLE